MHVQQAASSIFPEVADGSEIICVVKLAHGLVDAHRVKMGNGRKLLLEVGIPADDAAAVTEHPHDAAMLPVGFTIVKRDL